MTDQVKNAVKVTVSTGYDDVATSIVLAGGEGAILPNPTGNNYNLVWWDSSLYPDPADDPNFEIIRVTALSTDTLTVTRAQESTGASTKNTGGSTYKMILGVTAKTVTDLQAEIDTDIGTHAALTTTHGISGAIVGTSDIQTLSNKDISDTLTVDTISEHTVDAGVIVEGCTFENNTLIVPSKIAIGTGAISLDYIIHCVGTQRIESGHTMYTSGYGPVAVPNAESLPLNIDVEYTNATDHHISLEIDDIPILRASATGNGAGGITDLKTSILYPLHVDNVVEYTVDTGVTIESINIENGIITDAIIELNDSLGLNTTYEGLTTDDIVGESVVFGDLLYMKSDGKWWKASNAVASSAEFPVQGMAVATISVDTSGKILLYGTVRNDTWSFATLGSVFCGVDVPTHIKPTTSGYTVQIIGTSLDVEKMYFNPGSTYIELA